jgi:hypothetical protein
MSTEPGIEVYRFSLPPGVRKSAIVVVPVVVVAFYVLMAVVQPANLQKRAMWRTEAWWVGSFLMLALVHETCHAIGMRLAGARPRIGFRFRALQPFALADGHRFRRSQWIGSALAPLVVTVPLGLVLFALYPAQPWALVLAVMAPIGCSGDVDMVVRAVRNSTKGDLIEDTKRGFAVLRPNP